MNQIGDYTELVLHKAFEFVPESLMLLIQINEAYDDTGLGASIVSLIELGMINFP
jgi:hypothetical protein